MSIEKATKALDKAKAEADKWRSKLQEAKAKQAALAEQHEAVDVTPEQANRIFAEQDAEEQKILGIIDKIQPRIDRAAEHVADAERDVLRAHADEEQKLADAARKAWIEHQAEVSRALSAYLALEGAESLADLGFTSERKMLEPGEQRRIVVSKTRQLHNAFVSAQARAEAIRFFVEMGELAKRVAVNGEAVTVGNATGGRPLAPEEKPEILYGEQPERKPATGHVPFSKLRFGPDNRTLTGKVPGQEGYPEPGPYEEERRYHKL